MIQKEHILGGLLAVIVIVGVQISTQVQMQRITKQVEMVQDNLSASSIGSVNDGMDSEESFTREELLEIERVFKEYARITGQTGQEEYLTTWNRIRRFVCRNTDGVWTGDPENDCDRYMPTDNNPATQ